MTRCQELGKVSLVQRWAKSPRLATGVYLRISMNLYPVCFSGKTHGFFGSEKCCEPFFLVKSRRFMEG